MMGALPNLDPETGDELDIVGMLDSRAASRPDHTFIHTPTATLTYLQLQRRSARLAGALAAHGVGPGSSVTLMMGNSVEQVVTWFALTRLGALCSPLNTALVGDPLTHVLTVTGSRLAVVDADLCDRLTDATPPGQLETLVLNRRTRAAATPTSHSGIARLDLADLTAGGEPAAVAASDPLDPSTLLFTSGTTGVSKACILSRRYIAAQGAAHTRNLGLTEDDVLFCPFPLFHIDAATLTVVAALSVGATAALAPRFSASRFWDQVRASGATVFNFMGATLTILWKQPRTARDRDHRVRLAWGVPMPEWQDEWTARFGFPLYQLYGSTDAGLPAYDPVDGTQRAGACGRVTDLYEVRIAGDLPIGEILVRGRHPGLTMSGYYGMPEATAETIDSDGWVRTGDLGSLDSDGFLTFHGRSSDSIRRRGENISAFEVEQLALSHPDIVEAAAIGVPSELTEEDLMLCVVARPDSCIDPGGLHGFLAQCAPRHMVPRYIELVDELPKTPTQKIEKFKLKQAGVRATTWDAGSS